MKRNGKSRHEIIPPRRRIIFLTIICKRESIRAHEIHTKSNRRTEISCSALENRTFLSVSLSRLANTFLHFDEELSRGCKPRSPRSILGDARLANLRKSLERERSFASQIMKSFISTCLRQSPSLTAASYLRRVLFLRATGDRL